MDCFTHAGGRKLTTSSETKRNILAVLIAMSTNLGLARMSKACGVSYDVLAWTMEWYVREETLREANTVILGTATDSRGATLINFALFDLVGKALTPRMRGPDPGHPGP
ncbi:Tn3 family transposase [Nonomuraea sp. NPDC000554]|uniref:Tn3 family transposase n=1 Tax=Nonomuraea sp. NPDC000554 TaxID=3154259 RepID=UPI00332AA352